MSLVHLIQRVLAGLLVLLLLVGFEPRGPILHVSGEDSLGAIDEEERGKARGSAWGRPQAPNNRGQLCEPPPAKLVQLVEDPWLQSLEDHAIGTLHLPIRLWVRHS